MEDVFDGQNTSMKEDLNYDSSFKVLKIDAIVKGYHECPFIVSVEDHFIITKKRGVRGNALRVHSTKGQLGHLQKELVGVLWPYTQKIIDR